MLKPGSEEVANSLAGELISISHLKHYPFASNHDLHALVAALLSEKPEQAWNTLGPAIDNATSNRFGLQSLLGSRLRDEVSPFLQLPFALLFRWIAQKPDHRAEFLVAIAPLVTKDNDGSVAWSSFISRLIEEQGGNDAVREAIASSVYSYSWTGPLSAYWDQFAELFKGFENDKRAAVKEWARSTRLEMERQSRQREVFGRS